MTTESIRIPPERIVPVATEVASGAKTVAGVLGFFIVLFAIAAVGMLSDGQAVMSDGEVKDGSSTAIGIGIWLIALAAIALKFIKTARRATAAAELAKTNSGHEFVLSGKLIVVSAPGGIPEPHRSFKVSGKLRTMLLAVPQATVVNHD